MQIVCSVWLLERFLRDGTRAAESAVDEFAGLDQPGFTVGATVFAGRNENVVLGAHLADELRQAFPDCRLLELMDGAGSVHGAVEVAYKEIRRG